MTGMTLRERAAEIAKEARRSVPIPIGDLDALEAAIMDAMLAFARELTLAVPTENMLRAVDSIGLHDDMYTARGIALNAFKAMTYARLKELE